jgi:hypothetical protein
MHLAGSTQTVLIATSTSLSISNIEDGKGPISESKPSKVYDAVQQNTADTITEYMHYPKRPAQERSEHDYKRLQQAGCHRLSRRSQHPRRD